MAAIRSWEQILSRAFLDELASVDATVYGVYDPVDAGQRVPTFCFNLGDVHPAEVVEGASNADFGIRDGHMYAPRLMARLGLSMDSGAVRLSLVHYNTIEEIHRFEKALKELIARHA